MTTLPHGMIEMVMSLDADEIGVVYDMLKHRTHDLNTDAKHLFALGDSVHFNHKGKSIEGYVDKINQKTIAVKPHNGGRGWKVPASWLKHTVPAEEEVFKPLITTEDMSKLNSAIDEAAKKIVAQNQSTYNPLTGLIE